jgi:hypothetical protein
MTRDESYTAPLVFPECDEVTWGPVGRVYLHFTGILDDLRVIDPGSPDNSDLSGLVRSHGRYQNILWGSG